MIARHGAVPITESALRARIRNRRVGALKAGGRIYTNPLNLVAAGLLPVDVLSGAVDATAEIDDAELHAWLNPDEAGAEAEEEPDCNRSPDDTRGADERVEAEPPDTPDDAGPLERALTESARRPEATTREPRIREHRPGQGPRRPGRPWFDKAPRRLSLVRLGSVIAAGVAVAIVAYAQGESGNSRVSSLKPVALAAAADYAPPAELIDQAIGRRDYDKAMDLAALSGDSALLARTQRHAADALLARAERSRKRGARQNARRDVRVVRSRLGDPRPATAEAVSAQIARDERNAQRRARDSATKNAASTQAPATTSTQTAQADSGSPSVQAGSQASSSQTSTGSTVTTKKPTPRRDADKPVDPGLF